MQKFNDLKNFLAKYSKQGLCLAYSGGIDSSALLFLCKDFNVVAVTFKSVFQDDDEIIRAIDFCKFYGVKQNVLEYHPLDNDNIKNNPTDRCYYCKREFFLKIKSFAGDMYIMDGTNADDLDTYRPGIFALKELNIKSPLALFNITKKEIREFAKINSIKNFDVSSNSCYATRFPYNTPLCENDLNIVKLAEKIIQSHGFRTCRFRMHNNMARIEVPVDEINKFIGIRDVIVKEIKSLNISYVTLDLEGMRSSDAAFLVNL